MTHPKCPGHSKRDGHPCRNAAGQGTDHVGAGLCKFHGGGSPNGKKNAATEAASRALTNALAILDIRDAEDPTEALLEALRVACWRELGLRKMLATRDALFVPDHQGNDREDVVASMHDRALKRRAEIAKLAIDAGVSAAFVKIAERQAEVTVRAIQAALDTMISSGDRQTAEAAAATVLEASLPAGVGLN